MKITNLNLLPDGGYKLKRAIIKEESAFADVRAQLNNVLKKMEDYPGLTMSIRIFNQLNYTYIL